MTRKEQILVRAQGISFIRSTYIKAFIAGAEWADLNPKDDAAFYGRACAKLEAQLAISVEALKKIHEWHIGDNPASEALAMIEAMNK